MVMILETSGGFLQISRWPQGGPGWVRFASLIKDQAAGAAVDQRHGLGPLVHGGPSQGG
jgi:hypothetical protein